MRRLLYWMIHITITAAAWVLLHIVLGVYPLPTAVICAMLVLLDDTAVAKLARVLAGG